MLTYLVGVATSIKVVSGILAIISLLASACAFDEKNSKKYLYSFIVSVLISTLIPTSEFFAKLTDSSTVEIVDTCKKESCE